MTNSVSVITAIEKAEIASDNAFLVCLDIDVIDPATGLSVEVLHLVRNTEDIELNGVTYTATSFDMSTKSESGTIPQVSVSVKDYSREIQARMQAYGGGVGFNVNLMVVNSGNLDQPPELIEYFKVTGASAEEYTAQFILGTENVLNSPFPRRRQTKRFCQWRYKDPATCGYSGSMPTCDLTLQGSNGCTVHGNSPRFGGFPGMNNSNHRYG